MEDDRGPRALFGLIVGVLLAFVALVFAFGWGKHGETNAASANVPRLVTTN